MAPTRLDLARAARHDSGLAQLHSLRIQSNAFEDLADVRREHRRLDGVDAGDIHATHIYSRAARPPTAAPNCC